MQERKTMKHRKGVVSMGGNAVLDPERKKILDEINELLFTMSKDELFEVLKLVEDFVGSGNE